MCSARRLVAREAVVYRRDQTPIIQPARHHHTGRRAGGSEAGVSSVAAALLAAGYYVPRRLSPLTRDESVPKRDQTGRGDEDVRDASTRWMCFLSAISAAILVFKMGVPECDGPACRSGCYAIPVQLARGDGFLWRVRLEDRKWLAGQMLPSV